MESEKITKAQISKIWSRAKEIGIDEFTLYDLVEGVSGNRSIRGLSKDQGIRVIDLLQGKKSPPRLRREKRVARGIPNVIALATPAQLVFINDLKAKSDWSDEHLLNFIKKQLKRDSLKKLRANEAGVVIRVLNHAIRKKKEIA